MSLVVLLASVFLGAQESPAARGAVLRVSETIEGVVDGGDVVVRTETLDARVSVVPVRGDRFRVVRSTPGPIHIDLHAHVFDAYLVVRDVDGRVLAEDDDGWLFTHSRVVVSDEMPDVLEVEACALHGGEGPYRLSVVAGEPATVEREARLEQLRADGEECIAACRETLGPTHPGTVARMDSLAESLVDQQGYDAARELYAGVLELRERELGVDHPGLVSTLRDVGDVLVTQGADAQAVPLFERILAITESAVGPDHPKTASALHNLAVVLIDVGRLELGRRHLERALGIKESTLGPDHPTTMRSLNSLAVLHRNLGADDEARRLYERALEVSESTLGGDDPFVATCLGNLGALLHWEGSNDEARRLFERALAISDAALGPDHPDTLRHLARLASALDELGEYVAARPLLERALRAQESIYGPSHPSLVTSLTGLASVLQAQRALDDALPLYERALGILESTFGPDHPNTATGLHNLATILARRGATREARALLERALRIVEARQGPDHPDTGIMLSALASTLMSQGALEEAQLLLERAVRIHESTLGPNDRWTATSLNKLALALRRQGKLEASRALHERVWDVAGSAEGSEGYAADLALVEFDLGESESAFERVIVACRMHEAMAARVLWSLSEAERLKFYRGGFWFRELLLSLSRAAGDPVKDRAVYEVVLAGKGRVARSLLRDGVRALRALPVDERRLVARLRAAQRELAEVLYANEIGDVERHVESLTTLRAERNALEVELGRIHRARGPTATDGGEPTPLDALMRALPKDAASVDFLVHRWYEPAVRNGADVVRPGRATSKHVSAWVVRAGVDPVRVDLGEAAVVEEAWSEYLREIVGRRGQPVPIEGGEDPDRSDRLRRLVWDPLAEAIGDARTVFVSADGCLGALPFETLRRADGRHLIEEHAFVYLADLTRLPAALEEEPAAPPRLFAAGDVEYWDRAAAEADAPAFASADNRSSLSRVWPRLDWTGREVNAIADLHRQVVGKTGVRVVLKGVDATEERVKEGIAGFTHVHLATHGYFHPEGLPSAWRVVHEDQDGEGLDRFREAERHVVGYLPGLLSGLVFAGANLDAEPGRDNGLLTAEEVTYLDLTDCDLVVLSACETGLGRPQSGEGMIGLRRAFRMAGARTVVSSLWEVSDATTRDLMTLFYENLWRRGMSKLEALRSAQLSVLEANRERYGRGLPSTWGAFVLDGAPN